MASFKTIEEAVERARHCANTVLEPYLVRHEPATEDWPEFWCIERYTRPVDGPKIRINPTKERSF